MANARFAWGIDIGNRALKAIKLIREGDSLRVDDFEVIEHETVLSNSGDNREQLIINALRDFVQRHPMKGGAVAIGVSGQSSFARFIKLPPVEPKKIPEIVRFEAIQQIPFPLDDVEWSYQLFQGADSPDVEVGIFAMRKELINQHIKHFTDQDLNVQVVQMNPLSVYNAMSFDQRIEGTTMIIDLGAENTDLIICDADTVWMRSIPIGGNNFTEALVKSFKLNFAKAEDLKRNAATSKYARQIFQAMRPVFADLVAEVQRSIGFYASVHRDSRIKKIIAVGGTFKLPGLQKYLQQNLQLDVERLDTLGGGGPPDPKQAATYQDNILSLVSAYGLALQAMGEGKITSSLLPQRIRRERLWQEKTKFFAAAAALFALGTGIGYGSYFISNMSYESRASDRSTVQQTLSQENGLDSKWSAIQNAGASDRQRIMNIRGLTQYRDLWTTILQDIHKSVPPVPADLNQLKQIPRPQRKQIAIESMTTRYFGDIAPVLSAASLEGFIGTGPNSPAAPMMMPGAGLGFGAPAAAGPMPGAEGMDVSAGVSGAAATPAAGAAAGTTETGRGFVITLTGTTPFANANIFLSDSLVKSLLAMGKNTYPNGHPYYVARVEILKLLPLKMDGSRLAAIKAAYDAAVTAKQNGQVMQGGTYPGAGGIGSQDMGMDGAAGPGLTGAPMLPPAAGGVAAVDNTKAFQDRNFAGEDIRDDEEFIVAAVLVLDPPPKQQVAAAEGAAAEAAPATAPAEGAPATAPAEGSAAPAATSAPAAP